MIYLNARRTATGKCNVSRTYSQHVNLACSRSCLLCVLCIWHVAHLAWSRINMLVVTTKSNTSTIINQFLRTPKSPHKMYCEQDIQTTCEFGVLSCVFVVCFVYMTCGVVSYQHACGHNEKQYEHDNQSVFAHTKESTQNALRAVQPTCEFGVLSCVFVVCFVYMTCCACGVVSYQHTCLVVTTKSNTSTRINIIWHNKESTQNAMRAGHTVNMWIWRALVCVFVVRFVYMTCCAFGVVSFIFVTHAMYSTQQQKDTIPHQMHDASRPLPATRKFQNLEGFSWDSPRGYN